MGASCFTHRVHITPILKGFKLPHDQQKYDGSQEPWSWLSDYPQVVKILEGSKETTMQSLQLHLTGATRSWLGKLGKRNNWKLGRTCKAVHEQLLWLTNGQHQQKKSKPACKSTPNHFRHTYNAAVL
jgi:hypothetical protein